MTINFTKIAANFFAVLTLVGILAIPLLFAKNFAKVAGVKSASPYLIVSQVDKFPNITFSQANDTYKLSFQKQGPAQAYLSILIINNPTSQTQTYNLQRISGFSKVFFGEDFENPIEKLSVPSQASATISLLSEGPGPSQIVEFRVNVQ